MAQTSPAAEAALFSVLLEAAVDAIIVIDEVGTVRQTNSACARVFGYETSEIMGRNIKMLMPDHYNSEHDSYLHRYRETGDSKIIGIGRQVEGQRSNGEVFPMDLSVGEALFAGERLFVGIVRDLTEKQELLETLREREAELRQMMDSAVVPTGLIDANGQLEVANGALNRFLHTSIDEQAHLVQFLTDPNQAASITASLDQLSSCATVQVLRSLSFTIDSDIKTADVYLASFPQRTPAKNEYGLVIQLVDRTAQLEAEHAALAMHEKLGYFQRISTLGAMTAGIAHEVNQPMGAIANYAEAGQILLRKDPVPRNELESILQKIASQSSRASEVIRRLRSLAGGTGAARERVAPAEILREALRLCKPQLELHNINVLQAPSVSLPQVLVDRVQMQQVLLNLLQNAQDAMQDSESREITVAASKTEEGVVLSVRDSGHGIAPDVAVRLTDPFFTSKPDGMGIGLAVCRTIVEKHQGRFWFENNSDGPGATFFILLPEANGASNA